MADKSPSRYFTLVQRELQEYKISLFWTPIAIAAVLTTIMLVSVVLAGRISVMGDAILQVILLEDTAGGMNISIQIDEDDPEGNTYSYTIETEETLDEDDWNFSREWNFKPNVKNDLENELDGRVDSLNPMLNVLHCILVLVLLFVSFNYLLGTLYDDRKDRSFLFWRSLPVSEWEEVLAKLSVALIVAPTVFIAASLLMQIAYILLAMVLVWWMDMNPLQLVLGNIEFGKLLFDQISGWILTALWVAPVYAWLLFASAAARRSPFMFAVAPVVGLILLEEFFLGTAVVRNAIGNHMPHYTDGGTAVGFYFAGVDWGAVNYPSILLGLVFTALALWGAVYLRRHRWEI